MEKRQAPKERIGVVENSSRRFDGASWLEPIRKPMEAMTRGVCRRHGQLPILEETTKYAKDAKMEAKILFDEIIFEIKAVKQLADEHRAQAINSTGKQLGLLVNFGHYPKLEHERFINQTLSCIS
jgi:hypothetical protein